MALRERVFSLETEYGIQFYPDERSARPHSEAQVGALVNVLKKRCGLPNGDFLVNGAKFHQDLGHPEWALPECRGPREATAYDRAADQSLRVALPEAERQLADLGFRGRLVVFKNNVDSVGNTFGCHENYLMQRDSAFLTGDSFLRYMVRCLVPFLVTRQLYCGAGRLVTPENRAPASFRLSQRAEFTEQIVSDQTVKERAIVNLARENEPHAAARFRRLHLILGDVNLSGWASWMKLGVTGLLLRLIEDLYFQDVPLLANPVRAILEVADDLTGRRPLLLRTRQTMTAVEIQWHYYNAVVEYTNQFGLSDEENDLLDSWEKALEDLEADPMRLRDRADWAIKKNLMDAKLRAINSSWEDSLTNRESLAALKGIEARYHDLSTQGLFSRFLERNNRADTLVSNEEIEKARQAPPPFTRAYIRGHLVDRMRRKEKGFEVKEWNWGEMYLENGVIEVDDPLDFVPPALQAERDFMDRLELALSHEDLNVRLRATGYLARSQTKKAFEQLTRLIENPQEDERVRRAAVEAVGRQGMPEGRDVLINCLQDPVVSMRWAAEAALRPGGNRTVETPPLKPRAALPEERLVNLLS